MTRPAPAYINAPVVSYYSNPSAFFHQAVMVVANPNDPQGESLEICLDRSRGGFDLEVFSCDIDSPIPVTVHQLRALRDMIDFVLCEGPYSHVPAIAAPGRVAP